MSSPSDETVVRLILSEIKDGNPFKDTKKCESLVKSVYVINDIVLFSALIVRMKKKYAKMKNRTHFMHFLSVKYAASEGIDYNIVIFLLN